MRVPVRSSLVAATALALAAGPTGSPVEPEPARAAKNACNEQLNR